MAGGPTLHQMEKNGLKTERLSCLCLKGKCYCARLASSEGCDLCHAPVISWDMCDIPNNSG